jgi:hypothetical protein
MPTGIGRDELQTLTGPVLFELLDAMDGAAPTQTCCSCSPSTAPTCWNPAAAAVAAVAAARDGEWQGTASELLKELWPKDDQALRLTS